MKNRRFITISGLLVFIASSFCSCFIAKPPMINSKLMLDEGLAPSGSTHSLTNHLPFNNLEKIQFGDFQIIKLSNNHPLSKQTSRTAGGLLILDRTITTEYKEVYNLVVVSKTDTAEGTFTVLSRTVEQKPSTINVIKNKDKPSDYSKTSDPKILSGDFRISGSNLNWKFSISHYLPDSISNAVSNRINSLGELTNLVYPMSAKPLKIARWEKNRSGTTTYHNAGITLIDKYGKTVAALQIVGETKLWLNNDLNNEHKMAVAAMFVSMAGSLEIKH